MKKNITWKTNPYFINYKKKLRKLIRIFINVKSRKLTSRKLGKLTIILKMNKKLQKLTHISINEKSSKTNPYFPQ